MDHTWFDSWALTLVVFAPAVGAVITMLLPRDREDAIKVIEINARFGGGFPLANRAGAKFPLWMLESLLGRSSTASCKWEDNLLMLRYDSAVFISSSDSTQ